MLSAEELLAGGALTFDVPVPTGVIGPAALRSGSGDAPATVRLRPLTVRDLQLISRAAKDSDSLLATLMVQRALLEPELSVPQVAKLPIGLAQFLLEQVNRISGITATSEELSGLASEPLTRAAFVLAREFGWTPEQVSKLTLGQVLVHLQMLKESKSQ